MKGLIELVITVAVAVALALLIQAFIVKPYRIPSPSMVPTLDVGQRVLTNRLAGNPGLGDIVVFHPPHGADLGDGVCANPNQGGGHDQACDTPTPQQSQQTFIKRVVGLPGDKIQIIDGHVSRNGVREKDDYTEPCSPGTASCNFRTPITIPPGEYFMMGDNRPDSEDSRYWGPVPDKWIIGVAFFTYWPPDRIGFL
ncbi:MAG: signal peptidase I [Solirubrobacterales bacterium]|nr:signal peptidase I [Solirubrobacterales bacterium]MBV9944366.1 signal peptidase I [Solirubrobacterales bacterium]